MVESVLEIPIMSWAVVGNVSERIAILMSIS